MIFFKNHLTNKGTPQEKSRFLSGIAQITSPPPLPQFGQVVQLFLDVKNNVLACITESSKDHYDNAVSDNYDLILVLLMIFVLKMTKKYHIT